MDPNYKPSPYIDKPDRARKTPEKIISGSARLRKESFADRLVHMFISEDIDDIRRYLVEDVIVPGIKDAILDGISMLFNKTPYYRSSSSRSGYTPYSSASKSSKSTATKINTRGASFVPPTVETRADAEQAYAAIKELIDDPQFRCATVLDLYSFCGLDCDYAKDAWGWNTMDGIRIVRERDGRWTIECPKPELLTNIM